jgi:uncharacterized protein YbjT (DUF2867 family)
MERWITQDRASADRHLRCLARRPQALAGQVAAGTEIVAGDLLDSESLAVAMRGVHTAYYLVHSMGAAADFRELDRRAAANFARAARDAGVIRIIYLGGLGSGDGLSGQVAELLQDAAHTSMRAGLK